MSAQRHSRPVILCIDHRETETQLGLLRQVLEIAGYAVLTATNISTAFAIFRNCRVDLVLTEHIAPANFGGRTLAAILKKLKPEVPVVIYSADMEESPDDMRFANMFITKLVSVDELFASIRWLLEQVPARAAV